MKIDWYTTSPDKVYRYLFDLSKEKFGKVIPYIQYLIGYELSWRIEFNQKFDISKKDRKFYSDTLVNLIKEMDDDLITAHPHLDLAQKLFLLSFKHKDINSKIKYENNQFVLFQTRLRKKTLGFLVIDQIYIRENKLIAYGKLDRKYGLGSRVIF